MKSVVTLTMNPALDESTSVEYVIPDRKLRCQAPTYEPGGGGINVARAIRKLGEYALACFPVAGPAAPCSPSCWTPKACANERSRPPGGPGRTSTCWRR